MKLYSAFIMFLMFANGIDCIKTMDYLWAIGFLVIGSIIYLGESILTLGNTEDKKVE